MCISFREDFADAVITQSSGPIISNKSVVFKLRILRITMSGKRSYSITETLSDDGQLNCETTPFLAHFFLLSEKGLTL